MRSSVREKIRNRKRKEWLERIGERGMKKGRQREREKETDERQRAREKESESE